MGMYAERDREADQACGQILGHMAYAQSQRQLMKCPDTDIFGIATDGFNIDLGTVHTSQVRWDISRS